MASCPVPQLGYEGSRSGSNSSERNARKLGLAAGLVLASLCGTTGARAQSINCGSPTIPAVIPPGFTWTIPAACSALSSATAATTALTTADIAFLTESSAFVSAPANARPDQVGGGIWIRGVGGENKISSTGTASSPQAPGLSLSASSQVQANFSGFQAGADLGRFNLGASGLNVVLGVTGGMLDLTDQEVNGSGRFTFSVPFVGAYAAATKGSFFADFLVREDFYSEAATVPSFGLASAGISGSATDVMGSLGYRFDVDRWFIEPSVGLVWSRLNLGSVNIPGATVFVPGFGALAVPNGAYSFQAVDSLIGRAGVRIGTSWQTTNIAWQPFVAASVWNEFASDANSTFSTTNCPCGPGVPVALNISTSRVGTFEQLGVGTSAQILNTGWVGYARVDYRTGDNITGWDLTGGIRYQFSFAAPTAAPILRK